VTSVTVYHVRSNKRDVHSFAINEIQDSKLLYIYCKYQVAVLETNPGNSIPLLHGSPGLSNVYTVLMGDSDAPSALASKLAFYRFVSMAQEHKHSNNSKTK
jgi:hypothetical protein